MEHDSAKAVAAGARMRAAMMMDATGLTLLVVAGAYLASIGQTEPGSGIPHGLQITTLASLIGCVATADKAVLHGRTVILDILGAGTWALAVVLTPVAMIQRFETQAMAQMHFMMLVWLSLHGAVGVALAVMALRRREGRHLRRLHIWQRWLAVTGAVVLGYPWLLQFVA